MIELVETTVSFVRASFSSKMKGQGALEYIMVLSAVSIIIVIALAMVMQLKGTALHAFFGNSSGQSVTAQLANELSNLSTNN